MYYDRFLSTQFENLFKKDGELSWLIPYIKKMDDLDILIGKSNHQEYCSIYRGTSRIAMISKNRGIYKVTASDTYKKLGVHLYGNLDNRNFNEKNLEYLRQTVENNNKFDRYYNNHKEGYYQNMVQRKYGILADTEYPILIVDKEVVIGYDNEAEKKSVFRTAQDEYKECKCNLQKSDSKKWGEPSKDKPLGNELDLLALDREGNVHLIELKDGSNTAGIYMSPFQIGLYKRIFDKIDIKETLINMVKQKQRIGLLPKDWIIPHINNEYIPELIIGGYKSRSSGYPQKFNMVMKYIKEQNIGIYNDICNINVMDENLNVI